MRTIIVTLAVLTTALGIYGILVRRNIALPQIHERPLRGGDFTLQSAKGSWNLYKDAHGFVTLLYFGFTHCPGLCPMTLTSIQKELNQLSPEKRRLVKVVFVSVDYRADTPASVDAYTRKFGPEFVGLTGSQAELDRVTATYGAAYEVKETAPGSGKYAVNHSNQVFVINPEGDLADWLAVGYEDAKLGQTLRALIAKATKP